MNSPTKRRLVHVEHMLLSTIAEFYDDLPNPYRSELSRFHARTLSLLVHGSIIVKDPPKGRQEDTK